MSTHRRIARVVAVPPPSPGFVGPGHLASHVLAADDFQRNDPFIMLADDHLDIGDRPVGGAHPHAGFETVTLVLDGAIYDRNEGGEIAAGEVQWMTAGRGIIHGENVATRGKVRLLQLWLTLPQDRRWTTPGFQDLHAGDIPVRREPGVEVRVYSGASGKFVASTRNQVPVTIAEIVLDPYASVDQDLPLSYNGFAYVIGGSVRVGDEAALLEANQVGWLDCPAAHGSSDSSVLRVVAGADGARLVLYAGQPQGVPIVSYGPFIGESKEDILRLNAEYRAGRFERMSQLARTTAGARA